MASGRAKNLNGTNVVPRPGDTCIVNRGVGSEIALGDARLNLDDRPFSREELIEAAKTAGVLDERLLDQIRPEMEAVKQRAGFTGIERQPVGVSGDPAVEHLKGVG